MTSMSVRFITPSVLINGVVIHSEAWWATFLSMHRIFKKQITVIWHPWWDSIFGLEVQGNQPNGGGHGQPLQVRHPCLGVASESIKLPTLAKFRETFHLYQSPSDKFCCSIAYSVLSSVSYQAVGKNTTAHRTVALKPQSGSATRHDSSAQRISNLTVPISGHSSFNHTLF